MIFPVFVPTTAKKANVGKNCYANFEAAHCLAKRKKKRWEKKSSSSPFENWREQHEICSSFAILKDDEDDDFDVVTSIVIMDFGQSQKIRETLFTCIEQNFFQFDEIYLQKVKNREFY